MFGFTQIHELSHKTEWLLDYLRSDRIKPTSELIDLLLRSFDCLRNLVDNAAQSNSIDISWILKNLDEVLKSIDNKANAQPVSKSAVDNNKKPAESIAEKAAEVAAEIPGSWPIPRLFAMPEADITAAQQDGLNVYLARFDFITSIDQREKSMADFLKLLYGLGTVMIFQVDTEATGPTSDDLMLALPVEILYSTVIGQSDLDPLLEVPDGTFQLLAPVRPVAAQAAPFASAVLGSDQTEKPADANSVVSAPKAEINKEKHNSSAIPEAEVIQVSEKAEPTLRVKVSLLEDLMNLAGELVLSRNQLREGLNRNDMRAIRISGQRMGPVTSELQETIMMTRLQPLDRVFSKFPRMIRDLSKQLHKDILLTMEGKEVELDKTLIEGLGDPLTHMVRNAIDHGVETPEERTRIGKPNPARIRLHACYEASRVVIEVADDGHGIDGDRVCAKAVERGLISADKARGMTVSEKQNLVFLPGLSTAEKVSDLSGRGVGMDVVKSNIDGLGGKVEIASELGKGTSFKIKLPLTLAIIPSLILTTSHEMFAIPQVNVLEMLLIPAELIKRKIEVIGNQEVLVLRGKLLPLISMNHFLGANDSFIHPDTGEEQPERRQRLADGRSPGSRTSGVFQADHESQVRSNDRRFHAASGINVIVVTTGNFSYAIVVDKPLYTEEIVVKQLGNDLKGLVEYSGATILGDGRIALIIDVLGLATRTNILGKHALASGMADTSADSKIESDTIPFLAFRYGGPELMVLPLFLVSRLEKINPANVVNSGGWKAIHHGDRLLPVFMLSDLGNFEPLTPDQECGVIVIRLRQREIGLIAALPIQVIEIRPDFDPTVLKQAGIAGSKVWNWKSTLFVDIWEVLALSRPELLEFDHAAAYD